MNHSDHTRLVPAELIPETINGATVYGAGDEKVGSVDHMEGSGPMATVIVDVGGFLGLGAKPVEVPLDQLEFMRDEHGDVHALTAWTKHALENMPEHTSH